jgi:hypothetical protein
MKSLPFTLVVVLLLFATPAAATSVFGCFGILNAASTFVLKSKPSISKSNNMIATQSLALDLEDTTSPKTPRADKSKRNSPAVDIVQDYTNAIERDADFHTALKYLAADFQFLSPTKSFQTKEAWFLGFPKFHKNSGTIFQDPIPGAHDKQVLRKGTLRIAMLSVNLVAVYELNDKGEIVTIRAGRA